VVMSGYTWSVTPTVRGYACRVYARRTVGSFEALEVRILMSCLGNRYSRDLEEVEDKEEALVTVEWSYGG
jgi:hypothetical protein